MNNMVRALAFLATLCYNMFSYDKLFRGRKIMNNEFQEKDRKETRKNHLTNKRTHQKFIDDETKFVNKSRKVRKYMLEALEQEELDEEWEDYLK